jgi:phospholipase/carboxylesterase
MNLVSIQEKKGSEKAEKLLILLHGYGSHEGDLVSLADFLPGSFLLESLRAPLPLPWGGYAWYPIEMDENGVRIKSDALEKAVEQLEQYLPQFAQERGFAMKDVWLMGFSQGCIISLALALRNPSWFDGVIALSGYLSTDVIPKKIAPADFLKKKIFIAHGKDDQVIPVHLAQQTTKALETIQIAHTYHEYEMGHGVTAEVMRDLELWWKKSFNA